MDPNNNQQIKDKIIELLARMGFPSEVYERQEEGRTVFNIKCPDAKLLIGKQGSTLESLQHIIRIMVNRMAPEQHTSLAIDVDDYKDKRVIFLKELARRAAHEVKTSAKPVTLAPMPPYERRVIHNYLSLYSDIASGSVGKEPNRKVVVRPKSKKDSDPEGFKFIESL